MATTRTAQRRTLRPLRRQGAAASLAVALLLGGSGAPALATAAPPTPPASEAAPPVPPSGGNRLDAAEAQAWFDLYWAQVTDGVGNGIGDGAGLFLTQGLDVLTGAPDPRFPEYAPDDADGLTALAEEIRRYVRDGLGDSGFLRDEPHLANALRQLRRTVLDAAAAAPSFPAPSSDTTIDAAEAQAWFDLYWAQVEGEGVSYGIGDGAGSFLTRTIDLLTGSPDPRLAEEAPDDAAGLTAFADEVARYVADGLSDEFGYLQGAPELTDALQRTEATIRDAAEAAVDPGDGDTDVDAETLAAVEALLDRIGWSWDDLLAVLEVLVGRLGPS